MVFAVRFLAPFVVYFIFFLVLVAGLGVFPSHFVQSNQFQEFRRHYFTLGTLWKNVCMVARIRPTALKCYWWIPGMRRQFSFSPPSPPWLRSVFNCIYLIGNGSIAFRLVRGLLFMAIGRCHRRPVQTKWSSRSSDAIVALSTAGNMSAYADFFRLLVFDQSVIGDIE